MENVLVDTSVWMARLRTGDPELGRFLEALRLSGRIRTSLLVVAELMAGEPTDSLARELSKRFTLLPMVRESHQDWHQAGLFRRRALRARGEGRAPSLVDCYLGVVAVNNNVSIWTLDRAFDALGSEGLRLFRPR